MLERRVPRKKRCAQRSYRYPSEDRRVRALLGLHNTHTRQSRSTLLIIARYAHRSATDGHPELLAPPTNFAQSCHDRCLLHKIFVVVNVAGFEFELQAHEIFLYLGVVRQFFFNRPTNLVQRPHGTIPRTSEWSE